VGDDVLLGGRIAGPVVRSSDLGTGRIRAMTQG
jgi:hypothetical protein